MVRTTEQALAYKQYTLVEFNNVSIFNNVHDELILLAVEPELRLWIVCMLKTRIEHDKIGGLSFTKYVHRRVRCQLERNGIMAFAYLGLNVQEGTKMQVFFL